MSRGARTPAVLLVIVVLVAATVQLAWGWTDAWSWGSSHWRLNAGPPPVARPHPGLQERPPVRLAVAGDVGTGGRAAYATAAAADRLEAAIEFDALVLLGDNVYPHGDPAQVREKVLDPFAGVLDGGTLLLAALGNHDVETDDGTGQVRALGLPGRWYSQQLGPAQLVVVDSTRPRDPEQLAWLERTLARSRAPWTVVAQHHPPFSAGYHGSHRASRQALVPLYERFGVDLVLAGHDHDYQRIKPQRGIDYVVSGGAAKLRPTGRAGFTAVAASTYHFLELTAYADRLHLRAVDQHGRVFDELERRSGAGRR
jgi:hypothetical protein